MQYYVLLWKLFSAVLIKKKKTKNKFSMCRVLYTYVVFVILIIFQFKRFNFAWNFLIVCTPPRSRHKTGQMSILTWTCYNLPHCTRIMLCGWLALSVSMIFDLWKCTCSSLSYICFIWLYVYALLRAFSKMDIFINNNGYCSLFTLSELHVSITQFNAIERQLAPFNSAQMNTKFSWFCARLNLYNV